MPKYFKLVVLAYDDSAPHIYQETFLSGKIIPVIWQCSTFLNRIWIRYFSKNLWDDEFIFLHRGSGIFTLGEKEVMIKEGAFAFVPKGVWHGLQNTGNINIEMRFGYCPSGMENFFRETAVPVGQPYVRKPFEERKAIAKKYGFVPKVEPK